MKDKLKQLLIWSFEGGLGVQGSGFMVMLLGSNFGGQGQLGVFCSGSGGGFGVITGHSIQCMFRLLGSRAGGSWLSWFSGVGFRAQFRELGSGLLVLVLGGLELSSICGI